MGKRPRRVLGIDFSGASDAGRKIWIAEARRGRGSRLQLIDLRPAIELPDSGRDPTRAIAALAKHIAAQADTIAGCDFPFTLPKAVIDTPTWEDFVAGFAERFPDPDAFRAWALLRAAGRELRRAADRETKTPFNSYNLRIYRQTWWGIAALLRPLLLSGQAMVRPFQPLAATPVPILIEACPACLLKRIGHYPPYKGSSEAHRRARRGVLSRLIELGLLEPPPASIEKAILENAGGDALDAVIAAIATARAPIEIEPDDDQRLEGVIYA